MRRCIAQSNRTASDWNGSSTSVRTTTAPIDRKVRIVRFIRKCGAGGNVGWANAAAVAPSEFGGGRARRRAAVGTAGSPPDPDLDVSRPGLCPAYELPPAPAIESALGLVFKRHGIEL